MPWGPGNALESSVDVTVNSGPAVSSGLLTIQTPRQPVIPPSGILQPQPPMHGFMFPGTPVIYDIATTPQTGTLQGICVGRDQNVYAVDSTNLGVWQISQSGVPLNFFALSGAVTPNDICSGSDGNLWVTDLGVATLFQVTTAGEVTPFSLPYATRHICSGPDGNLWLAGIEPSFFGSPIFQVSTAGEVLNQFTPTGGTPYDICAGPDGNLWFTDTSIPYVGRLTTEGVPTLFTVSEAPSQPDYICCGSDGNLWVVNQFANTISRFTPQGIQTSFPVSNIAELGHAVAGAGGDVWMADTGGALWKVTPEGQLTKFPFSGGLDWICSATDGGLWLTVESGALTGSVVDFPFTIIASGLSLTIGPVTTCLLHPTGSYAMNGTESTVLCNEAITLPPPASNIGAEYTIKDDGGGTGSLLPNASETIDGQSSIDFTAYESVVVTSDGTNWYVKAQVATSVL